MVKVLNVVSFNIPWPANYGGVIDVYYKIKALHDRGIRIILHCYEYERPRAAELEAVCEQVYYYPRRVGLRSNLSLLPYNVYSRKSPALIARLLENEAPILFEGLHTCYYLDDKRLNGRFKIFRECNIEHDYYREIGRAEKNPVKKVFYYIESMRFKSFQRVVSHADLMIAVSMTDADYLRSTFPTNRVEFIPCFHEHDAVCSLPGSSDFILYHGKLSVKENEKAALYLIDHVFSRLTQRCVIAGMDPSPALLAAAGRFPHIEVEANPSATRMEQLIREAHINLLVTFQSTGLKLKLLNSLFSGRHVVVNPQMLAGSGLESVCHVAESPEMMIARCEELKEVPFDESSVLARQEALFPTFSNGYQADQLITIIGY